MARMILLASMCEAVRMHNGGKKPEPEVSLVEANKTNWYNCNEFNCNQRCGGPANNLDHEYSPTATNPEGCKRFCEQTPGCGAFVWNGPESQYHNNVCNLKTSCPYLISGWGFVTGTGINSNNGGNDYCNEFRCNTRCGGAPNNMDHVHEPVEESPEGCKRFCEQTPGCHAFVWNGPNSQYHNNACNLKTACDEFIYGEGFVTGTVY